MTDDKNMYASNIRCQDICKEKGYILAATQSKGPLPTVKCYCGNVYPNGKIINGTYCNRRCRSYTECQGPVECCGGDKAYSVSVVGNIDVPKQILRRLSKLWQSQSNYRSHMQRQVPNMEHEDKKIMKAKKEEFSGSRVVWSCPVGYYLAQNTERMCLPPPWRLGAMAVEDQHECKEER